MYTKMTISTKYKANLFFKCHFWALRMWHQNDVRDQQFCACRNSIFYFFDSQKHMANFLESPLPFSKWPHELNRRLRVYLGCEDSRMEQTD